MKQFLYLHSEIVDPKNAAKGVSIVETPELADCLAEQGIVATCLPKDGWCPDHTEALAGRMVVLLPSGDADRFWKIFEAIVSVAKSVRYVDLGMTARDWFEGGGNKEGLREAVLKVEPLKAPRKPDPAMSAGEQPRTEQPGGERPGVAPGGSQSPSGTAPAESAPADSAATKGAAANGAAVGSSQQSAAHSAPPASASSGPPESVAGPAPGAGHAANGPEQAASIQQRAELEAGLEAGIFISAENYPSVDEACRAAADLIHAKAGALVPLDWMLLVKGVIFDLERLLLSK